MGGGVSSRRKTNRERGGEKLEKTFCMREEGKGLYLERLREGAKKKSNAGN